MAAVRAQRFDRLDALRGAAIVWMALFHFCYDLNHYGLIAPPQQFLSDPFWTLQRTAIVSLFLLCAGAGQAVAGWQSVPWPRFWRRWAQVAGCALLVSAASAWMFGPRWISFGVLHAMALMTLLVRLAVLPWLRREGALAARGAVAVAAAGAVFIGLSAWPVLRQPLFDRRWLNWTGLVTYLPPTEDYVPLLPWLGVLLFGLAAAWWWLARRPQVLTGPLPRALRPLAVLGRWSLSFYMLHQPVLIGLILAWLALVK